MSTKNVCSHPVGSLANRFVSDCLRTRAFFIVLLPFLFSMAPNCRAQTLDQYGGRTDLKCANATGWFHTEKIGNRWWLCTPAGNAFFMQGVEQVVPSVDNTYKTQILAKYGDEQNWSIETNQRLLSWGFNTLATGAYFGSLPTAIDSKFPRDALGLRSQAVKMPFTASIRPAFYSMVNPVMGNGKRLLSEPVKNVLYGHSPYYHGWVSPGGVSDYFDTNVGAWLAASLQIGYVWNSLKSSPFANYLIGITSDDGDEMNGFSTSTDFPTIPPGRNNLNLSMMVAAMSPVQTANSHLGWVYTNTTVHTKAALHDFLLQKYGTVAAFNSAWGSNYTTFDSSGTTVSGEVIGTGNGSALTFTHTLANLQPSRFSVQLLVDGIPVGGDTGGGDIFGPDLTGHINYKSGLLILIFKPGHAPARSTNVSVNYIRNGWEIGTGFMDEDDRPSHQSWMGDGWIYMNDAKPDVKADMNAFLEQMAAQYFKTCHDQLKTVFPHILYLGPDSLGTRGDPPPASVLQAAGQYMDAALLNGISPFSQAQLDYIEANFGKPFFGGFYSNANPDSALQTINPTAAPPNGFPTQAARGQAYANYITGLLADKSSDGVYPYIGVTFWELTDYWGEKTNWGIVTHHDNAYDGNEDVNSSIQCSSPLEKYACGGEKRNYGDVISWLKKANHLWLVVANSASAASRRAAVR